MLDLRLDDVLAFTAAAASLAAVVRLLNSSIRREVERDETQSKQDEHKKKEELEKQLPARTESGNQSRLPLIC